MRQIVNISCRKAGSFAIAQYELIAHWETLRAPDDQKRKGEAGEVRKKSRGYTNRAVKIFRPLFPNARRVPECAISSPCATTGVNRQVVRINDNDNS